MISEIVNIVGKEGSWALLSFGLILYILKAQEKRDILQEQRDEKYQEIIETMTCKLDILTRLSEDINDIKSKLQNTVH